jgi:hypothetical protein
MTTFLSEKFWNEHYVSANTGWDIGAVSTPLKEYFDTIEDKSIRILIPGCGNAYEAEYLDKHGFTNVTVIDIAKAPIKSFLKRVSGFPVQNVIKGDLFEHVGEYDLIIEQTFFCAIDPSFRSEYARKMRSLLASSGQLVGLLFNVHFVNNPPFGGDLEEYREVFRPYFKSIKIEDCYNSIQPREGREFFIRLKI